MGLTLKAGRWFDPDRPMDDMTQPYPPQPEVEKAIAQRGVNVVLNEYAVQKLGFKSPQDAIGKVVKGELLSDEAGQMNINIIGVVGDSRFRSVRTPIDAIMFRKVTAGPGWMMIRYRGDPATVRAAVERQWKQITNEVPFNAKFSEDIMAEAYKAEDARAKIFAAFAILAVIIGCLGLFGLAAFTAERRTKEIGIRKVLGARTRDIVRLLVWQFSRRADRQCPCLAGGLVADARLAQHLRCRDHAGPDPVPGSGCSCIDYRRCDGLRPMPSVSPAQIQFTPFVTNRNIAMWRNYLTVGVRSLAKNRAYAAINIVGARDRHGGMPDDPALRPL